MDTHTQAKALAQAPAIRDLNDRFRKGDASIPGRTMITLGVQDLAAEQSTGGLEQIVVAVRSFDRFDADNDPHHEHDFGAFEFHGQKLFWKIDYYAPDLQHGSEDPADISKTVRVLTIMLASEY